VVVHPIMLSIMENLIPLFENSFTKSSTNTNHALIKRYSLITLFLEALVEDDYESLEVLIVSSSADDCQWILDFDNLFHMTSSRLWFQ